MLSECFFVSETSVNLNKRYKRGWSLLLLLFIVAAFTASFPLIFSHLETGSRMTSVYENYTRIQRAPDFIPLAARSGKSEIVTYSLSGTGHLELAASAVDSGKVNQKNVAISSTVNSQNSGFSKISLVAKLSGDGSPSTPFAIASVKDLELLRENLEPDKNFVITDSIDFADSAPADTPDWTPVGNRSNPFRGTFWAEKDESGNYYTISGATVRHDKVDSEHYGFFGAINGGKLLNINLKDVKIAGGTAVAASSGGLAGLIEGNCEIADCSVTGEVSGRSTVGGLVGKNLGSAIIRCSSLAAVAGADTAVGGLVGYSNGAISGSSSTGNVSGGGQVGGLVGLADTGCTVTSSQATGNVSANGLSCGGLIGQSNAGVISLCRATGAVTAIGNNVGGLIGKTEGGSITNSMAFGSSTGEASFVGGLVGNNSACAITNCFARGTAVSNGYNYYVGGFVGATKNSTIGKSYSTGNASGFAYIGGFAGSHDSGTVNSCYAEGTVSSTVAAGGFVGIVKAGNINKSYAQGAVTGSNGVGGFSGNNQGTIDSCYAQGTVQGTTAAAGFSGMNSTTGIISKSYSAGAVTGTTSVGGFIGTNANLPGITNCYWDATVSGQAVSAGGESRTTAQLQQGVLNGTVSGQTVYSSWVNTDWHFNPTNMYPRLKSAYTLILQDIPTGTYQRDSGTANVSTVSGFRIGIQEVTQQQFLAVTGRANPSAVPGSQNPVQGLSWYAAIEFCNRLSILEGLTPMYKIAGSTNPDNWGTIPTALTTSWDNTSCAWTSNGYRLPTEDEWQWAAMGAQGSWNKAFAGSNGTNLIDDYVWYSVNSGSAVNLSAAKKPNELGLYDCSGNMWEVVWDRSGTATGTRTNYRGPTSGTNRIVRGGDYTRAAIYQTIIYNIRSLTPYSGYANVGLRVAKKLG